MGSTGRSREWLAAVAGVALVALLLLAGAMAVRARAQGAAPRLPLAPVQVTPASSPSPSWERWTVLRALRPVVAYARPDTRSRVIARFGVVNANGFPSIFLVDRVREAGGRSWYRVWLPVRPNGTRGWVREGGVSFYTTSAKILVDLSERRLRVYRRGQLMGEYPVAIGRPGLETPTGFFYVNQKLRPPDPHGAYGVVALGLSAFQPKLPHWPQGGPVAIHGTNQPELIGKAVSHGCIRMYNRDVREVDRLVPAGSPVVIQE